MKYDPNYLFIPVLIGMLAICGGCRTSTRGFNPPSITATLSATNHVGAAISATDASNNWQSFGEIQSTESQRTLVQPFESVTVTQYTPSGKLAISCVTAPVDHRYE